MDNKLSLKDIQVKLEYILEEMKITDLNEFTIGSAIGSELTDVYSRIISYIAAEKINCFGKEISDGKYEIGVTMPNNKDYYNISKGWYTKEDVQQVIMEIFQSYFNDMDMEKEPKEKADITEYSIEQFYKRGVELYIVIMVENLHIVEAEIYIKEEQAIEAFENWIELSYEDYLQGNKMEEKFKGSTILKRSVILDKENDDSIVNEILKKILR